MQSQFVVSTDKQEKIKLESGIIEASLISPVAYGGFEVQFEVKTVFVAEGSAVEVKGRSSKGKAPDTIKGKIFNNTFRGSLLIPEKVSPDAEIWFEAKLPKHGLKMDSNAIPARPSIGVKKMCWDREKIVRNELVKLTCQFADGVQDGDDAVFIIYEHNPNSCDMKVVSIPATVKGNTAEVVWEFTYKGNTADIPTQEELQKVNKSYVNPQYYFVVSVKGQHAGKKRESGLLKFRDTAEFRVFANSQEVISEKTVTFTFADGTGKDGTTDKDGVARVTDIPPGPFFVKAKDDGTTVNKPESNSQSDSTDAALAPKSEVSVKISDILNTGAGSEDEDQVTEGITKDKLAEKIKEWHDYTYNQSERRDCSGFVYDVMAGDRMKGNSSTLLSTLKKVDYDKNKYLIVYYAYTEKDKNGKTDQAHVGILYEGKLTHFQNFYNTFQTPNSYLTIEDFEKRKKKWGDRGGAVPVYLEPK